MADITEQLSSALADRYRIERRLGEGGMATVYLADDLKHDRKVALKVLRPELGVVLGAERFLQEIKTTARLQHPHILPLYDSGSTASAPGGAPGLLYYVMPYVEGETLRAKLDHDGQLGINEAVSIATEVADALQYAHDQGVIHRDIKPENVLLRNGRAYVADFGIALAVSAAAGGRMTETGLSLGTPHYMSPEQATADKHITNRSDIYSLGSVLYEMLTGEPPHTGPSAQIVILKIISDPARSVRDLRKAVPPNVSAAVAEALEKTPADRFENAKAFADALHNPSFTTPIGTSRVEVEKRAPSEQFLRPALIAGALLGVAALGFIVASKLGTGTTVPTAVARFPTTLGAEGVLDGLTFGVDAALSPDGSSLVYRSPLSGPGRLYIKLRDEVLPRPLTGTDGGSGPFFSPDGATIGFVAEGQLRRVPAAGGAPIKIADSVDALFNRGTWLHDGSIIFYDAPSRTLKRVLNGESKAKTVVSREMLEGRFPWLPSPLPDSRGVLFTAHRTECVGPVACRPSRVYVYDAKRDTIRALFEDAIGAWHVPTGHVLYLTIGGTLMAAPWDNNALEATAKPVTVMDGIQAPGFQIANDGTAYYLSGRPEFAPGPVPNAAVVWVDRAGNVEPVDSAWQVNTGGTYTLLDESTGWGLALSPDGKRLAFTAQTELGTDIWIKQMPTGPATRLTQHPGIDRAPAWTPDGRSVTFLSDRPTAGSAASKDTVFNSWEQIADGTSDARLISAPTRMDSVLRRLAATGATATGASLSPDSRWIAYVSNEQGANEVFVRPYPEISGGKYQVSRGGGSAPVWARSGRELFYVAKGKMYAVSVTTGASFSADSPRALFTIPSSIRFGSPFSGTFAIAADDLRFLMVRDNVWEVMAGSPTLVVVQNFFEELRKKLK
jgi:Tol biopolymer transport system component